jgi:hypothetical protein
MVPYYEAAKIKRISIYKIGFHVKVFWGRFYFINNPTEGSLKNLNPSPNLSDIIFLKQFCKLKTALLITLILREFFKEVEIIDQ